MRLHTHFKDGAPMAPIARGGSFRGDALRVESCWVLNPSMRDEKRHTRVHKGCEI